MTVNALIQFLQRDVELNPHLADSPIFLQTGGEITGMGSGGRDTPCLTSSFRPEVERESSWEYFEAMFRLAGIKALSHYELANQYWPRSYMRLVAENPWWLVRTTSGNVVIGWRKRVLSISWSDTPFRRIITDDETTKEEAMVHAWTEAKAIEYLKTLSEWINQGNQS